MGYTLAELARLTATELVGMDHLKSQRASLARATPTSLSFYPTTLGALN